MALPPGKFLFASECATEGHPDKLCDRVSDAVLDACLSQDPESRVNCDTCSKTNMVMVLGEMSTKANIKCEQVVREAVKAIGFDNEEKGLDWKTMNVIVAIDDLSITANRSVDDAGTGDLGIAYGYATDETSEMMPLSQLLASQLCAQIDKVRKNGPVTWLHPMARAQVTVEYNTLSDGGYSPVRVHSVDIEATGSSDVTPDQVRKDLLDHVVKLVIPERYSDQSCTYNLTKLANRSDTGLCGRKLPTDLYGGWCPHGISGLSGRDGSKVSRCATYAARWIARSLVTANFCKRCQVQLAYSPGAAKPSVSVMSYGTSQISGKSDADLTEIAKSKFDLRLGCLQRDLGLKALQFQKLSACGHMGRDDIELPWEKPMDLK